MKTGGAYKDSKTGKVFTVQYATARAVALVSETGTVIVMARRDFDTDFQEVKSSGRKAAGKK